MASGAENSRNVLRESESRLRRLIEFLDADPGNLDLIADAASAAFDAGNLDTAQSLLDRHRGLAELPPMLLNLNGLVALRSSRLGDAAAAFDTLIAAGVNDPSVRFNRAWVHALLGEHEQALALLDDEAVGVTPRAAALKVQMLHHLGRIEDALSTGHGLAERFPGNEDLLGALSVVAMDADDLPLAAYYAEQAGGGADALTTRGLVALNEDRAGEAMALFDDALARHPEAARAWLGKGLGLIATGQVPQGTAALQRGAEIFGDHLGSWIAVGWTQVIAKDLKAARATFEKALALDENFAESHGGLAVLDIAEGNLDGGKRRSEIALRLDKQCFGGMLARMLLNEASGNVAAAQRIWDRALEMPAGANGKTLAEAMIGMGLNPGRGQGSSS